MKHHTWILLGGMVAYSIVLWIAFTEWSNTAGTYVGLIGLAILSSYSWYTGRQTRQMKRLANG